MPSPRNRRHIQVTTAPQSEPYSPHRRRIEPPAFARPPDRRQHADALQAAATAAQRQADERRERLDIAVHGVEPGLYIQFEAPPGVELKIESLENKRKAIELVAVQQVETTPDAPPVQRATVFVPYGQLKHFVSRFEEYATKQTEKGEPRNKEMVDRIAALRLASLEALWTDPAHTYPLENQTIWWEVWLRIRDGDGGELHRLMEFAALAQIEVGARRLAFDDRLVVLVRATPGQLAASLDLLNDLAEVRGAKEGAAFFVDLPANEQAEWIADLRARLTGPAGNAPAVCLLDTGVNHAHPLLDLVIAPDDASAVDPTWGSHDNGGGASNRGHGTEMSGLAVYGDLVSVFASTGPIQIRHRLESVKILPPAGANRPELYGAVTAQAVSRPEVQSPGRRRVFSLAVTATGERDRGQPTSWSAAVDALAAGRMFDAANQRLVYLDQPEEAAHRLFVVSAGNVPENSLAVNHVDRSDIEAVHDPAQSWNALTVGACTEKAVINDATMAGWSPVALPGELSPWSTTSLTFAPAWPIKPDVVYEGGNVAHDAENNFDGGVPDLCLLSTYHLPHVKPLVVSHATSAATAQVARMGAIVAAEYPGLWPETVRALVVHSAQWTNRMRAQFDAANKQGRGRLVRRYGFGVPDLARALRSANDALTLVAEARIHPFAAGKMREMHVHALPWPREALEELGEQLVRLRVTLSYFIEPNPGRRGWKKRHRYASHGLRFDVKSPTDSLAEFRKRLNRRALDEDEERPTATDTPGWFLGEQARNKGSIHSDILEDTAANLAERGVIGVYPVSGWWKDQPKRDRSAKGARYALVVSIETDAEDVDIWTPVALQVGVPVQPLPIDG